MDPPVSEFNPAQVTAFFEDFLRVDAFTRQRLADEGVVNPEDLFHFNLDMIKQVDRNLRKPNGEMLDPAPNAAANARVPIPATSLSPISLDRLKKAMVAVQYYAMIARPININSLNVASVNAIDAAFETMKAKKTEKRSEVPRYMPKSMSILYYHDLIMEYISKVCGARGIPLVMCARKEEVPTPNPQPLLHNRPYSNESGSVMMELVNRSSFEDPNFVEENSEFLNILEEGFEGTHVYPTLKAFRKKKDGRKAWFAIMSQYMSVEKWRGELKRVEGIVTKRVWKGDGTETLEEFFALHRNCNTTMDNGNDIVEGYVSPEERRKVERALDAIKSKDPTLLAAIANIRQDDNPDGMMNNFEKAVAYLIPACPVAPNRKTNKSMAHIANVELKTGRGKSGVEFRFYTDKEYRRLSEEQKLELRKYRASQAKVSRKTKFDKHGKKGYKNNQGGFKRFNASTKRKGGAESNEKKSDYKKLKGAISEAVVKVIRQDSKEEPNEYIISLVKAANAKEKQQTQAQVNSIQAKGSSSSSKLFRNAIVKGTTNKGMISACVMKRISYQTYEEERVNDETNSIFDDSPEVEVASLRTFAEQTRTELDSHANMPVFGKHRYIENREEVLSNNKPGTPGCRYATVQAYSLDMEVQELPIVDVAVGGCGKLCFTAVLHTLFTMNNKYEFT